MTAGDLDLTEAVEAAAQARYGRVRRDRDQAHLGEMPAWHDLAPQHQHGWREGVLNEVTAAAPLIAAQVAEQIAREIEAAANTRAAKRDEHREIAVARRAEGNLIGHDAHMRTALSFRSEATGMWDAALIAREAVR